MKKPMKLNLNDLKVESFVTSFEGKESETIKGGSTPGCANLALFAFSVVAVVAITAAYEYNVKVAVDNKKKEETKK